MGRGLSRLQRDILRVLAVPQTKPPTMFPTDPMIYRPHEIIDALGRPKTPSNYASVSKALGRLCVRRFVLYWSTPYYTPGKGYRYSLSAEGWQFIERKEPMIVRPEREGRGLL